LAVPAVGRAQGQPPSDGRRTVARLPVNVAIGTVGVFSPDNLKPAIAGGLATGLGAIFDDRVAEAIADPDNGFGQSLETGGGAAWSGGVVAALFVAGRFTHGTRFRAASYDWAAAALVNAGYTSLLKAVVGRERPNGEDNRSFPSGHASNAFTLAAVAERHYGWKAGVPAYGLATAVALSRLQRNKHYLSDVMAGATLGYIVGRTVVRVNGRPLATRKAPAVSLSPVVARRTRALALSVIF
jgi:membrane-associated phospholipid phosphatase